MKRRIILIFIVYILFSSFSYSNENIEKKDILYISSYSPSFMTFNKQINGIKSVLDEKNYNISIQYMDSKQFFSKKIINNFRNNLKYKLKTKNFDLIIVADDNAYNFAFNEKNELFKDIPIIFLGVNNHENALKANNYNQITGVIEDSSLKKNLEISTKLQKSAKKIYIITDPTPSGQGDLKKINELKIKFDSYEFEILDTSKITFDSLKTKLNNINSKDIILFLSLYRDLDNNKFTFYESINFTINNTNAPIFHPYMHGIGDGLIGGHVVNHYEQGKSAGLLARSYFNNKSLDNIKVIEKSPNTYYFDYNIFNKYNISKDLLPEDTILINYSPSFFEKYYVYIFITILILIIESIIIFFLFYNLKKRKKAEKDLIKNQEILEMQNEEIIAQYNELTDTKVELEKSKSRYVLAFKASKSGLFDKSLNENKLFITKNWYSKYLRKNKALFENFLKLMNEDDYENYQNIKKNHLISDKEIYSIEFVINSKLFDKPRWIHENGIIIRSDDNEPTRIIGSHMDITSQKENTEKIQNLLTYDRLTNLYNKKSVEKYLSKLLNNKSDKKHAVIFIDIDNFKYINDTYGHKKGDYILKELSNRFKNIKDSNYFLARFGGDEFIFIYEEYKSENILKQFINKILKKSNKLISIESSDFNLSISIGISLYPKNSKNAIDLISKADLAMYEAKKHKNKSNYFYNENLYLKNEKKLNFSQNIKNGIENNEFFMVYQPIINSKKNQIFSAEALMRWNSENYGKVTPNEFIPIAEESGLIYDLGIFGFKEIFKFIDTNKIDSKISINLSSIQIQDPKLISDLKVLIDKFSINPENIILEITETSLMKSIDSSLDTINKLKELNFIIALDDFGTGYSSLNYIQNLPVDILKIDKSFIDKLTKDSKEMELIKAILLIANSENLEVVCEGVETNAQLKLLNDLGFYNIQGYLFSKPLNNDEFIQFYKNN